MYPLEPYVYRDMNLHMLMDRCVIHSDILIGLFEPIQLVDEVMENFLCPYHLSPDWSFLFI